MDPFLGEIRLFPFGIIPRGWVPCDGRLLQITQNQALYAVMGPAFGGDGRTTFAVPDLRGCVPVHPSASIGFASTGGEEKHGLTEAEIPSHAHIVKASPAEATEALPSEHIWSALPASAMAFAATADKAMSSGAMQPMGAGQPHENRQPYLALNYCIALVGLFPSRC